MEGRDTDNHVMHTAQHLVGEHCVRTYEDTMQGGRHAH